MANTLPPSARELSGLRPRNSTGALYFSLAAVLTGTGAWLSLRDSLPAWSAGQLVLATALLQWFILLHEAGHRTLFGSRVLNIAAGHLAGLLSGFPYSSWVLIHFRHHKWTGWQDLDATTASLVPRQLKRWERLVINFCWKTWIPLFSLLYRINNYWNYPRVVRHLGARAQRKNVARDILALLLAYAVSLLLIGPAAFLQVFGVASLITLVMQEALLLSQHTHIPTNISHGRTVRPFPPREQEAYTRSLRFPAWISRVLLMHFDAHELHHMYVRVPGYDLGKISYQTRNTVDWWRWIRGSRGLSGVAFLFSDKNRSGVAL
jgi:omega-6 fatty acid desaturase (delta-12 desaturase)